MSKRYEHSPIIEALCQFQFEPNSSWDLTVPGLIYERVQKVFPKRNQVVPINLAANPGVVGQALPLMQFISEDEKSLIQVGQDLLTVNQLKPYSSWQDFLPLIKKGLQAYKEAAQPKHIQRVALQYINRIEFEQSIRLEDYLNFYPFLGEELSQDIGAFVIGVQIPYENARDILNLQLTRITPEIPDGVAMILDLNYVLTQPGEITLDNVLDWVNDVAHKHVEDAFEACIKAPLRQMFKEVEE